MTDWCLESHPAARQAPHRPEPVLDPLGQSEFEYAQKVDRGVEGIVIWRGPG
jgi:hypothetical protein